MNYVLTYVKQLVVIVGADILIMPPNIIDEVPVLPVLPSSPELSIIDIYKNSNVK